MTLNKLKNYAQGGLYCGAGIVSAAIAISLLRALAARVRG